MSIYLDFFRIRPFDGLDHVHSIENVVTDHFNITDRDYDISIERLTYSPEGNNRSNTFTVTVR